MIPKAIIIALILCVFGSELEAQNLPNLPDTNDVKPVFSGFLRVEGGLFESSRNPPRMPGRRFLITGNPQMRIGDWNIKSNLQIGNYEDRLLQPFNKFGISPNYKWITVHLGHHQQSFSPFTYNNHLLFGGGLELNPGKLRFTILYGNLLRQSTGGIILNDQQARPSFQRRGFIGKIGFGSSDNFVDLILVSGKDDASATSNLSDSLRIYPQENIVLGIHTEQRFAKFFRLELSGAISAYTRDTRSSEFESDPFFGDDFIYSVFTPRISSQYLGAGLVALEFRKKVWNARAEYSLIQPGFQSMGAYFNQSDLSKFNVNAQGRILKNRLSISGIFRTQRNNILNTRTSENRQNFGSLQLSWFEAKSWTGLLSASYFTSKQTVLVDTLSNAFGFDQNTFQISGNFTKRRPEGGEHYSGQILFLNRYDRIAEKSAYRNLTFRSTYTIILSDDKVWSMRPELALARFEIPDVSSTWRISPAASLLYNNREDNITGRFSMTPTFELLENTDNRFSFRTALDLGKRIKRKHRFSLRVNHNLSTGGFSYNEFRLNISYQYSL